jgi:beta-glucanase (GH16 family)
MRTLGTVAAGHKPPAGGGGTVLLFDDFLGTSIDTTKWQVYDRIGDLVNSEVNCIVPANVRVAGSMLLIDSKAEAYTCSDTMPSRLSPGATPTTVTNMNMSYTSGQVAHVMPSFLYGRVDVRQRVCPIGRGTWPCIWMLGDGWKASQPYTANTPNGFDGWPNDQFWEIDIAEFMESQRIDVSQSVHYLLPGGYNATFAYDAATRFIVYRLDWSLNYLGFSVDYEDGTGFHLLHTETGSSEVPHTPGYLMIHTAIGGKGNPTTGGPSPDPATFPVTTQVDYVRITQP